MGELIFLNPVFKTMIWGGNRMKSEYGYDIPADNTGECWAISAHENGDCTVRDGKYAGIRLSELYKNHGELFGDNKDRFPLLVKIIDAKADLSVQVHPDDIYAAENENGSLGKTECWYILDCDNDAQIIVGHNAKTKEELADMIYNKRWNDLISPRPIKKGDFFQIEPGTVHAIKKGTLILETQQSSDITYRLYDYDRLQNGKPRELHIEKSIDVINCPHIDSVVEKKNVNLRNACLTKLVDCKFYEVNKLDVYGEFSGEAFRGYALFSIIDGEGKIDGCYIKKGDHFIMPKDYGKYKLEGTMSVICSLSK